MVLHRPVELAPFIRTYPVLGGELFPDCQLFETWHHHDTDLAGPALAEYSLCRVREKAYDAQTRGSNSKIPVEYISMNSQWLSRSP